MIGTTTALILGGLAAAGQATSATIASKSAKKAAKTQSEAANAVSAENRAERAHLYQDYAPYANVGYSAAARINDMVNGIGGGPGSTPAGSFSQTQGAAGARTAQPRSPGMMTSLAQNMMPVANRFGPQAQGAPVAKGGGMIRVTAPDGSESRVVPADQEAHWAGLNARIERVA